MQQCINRCTGLLEDFDWLKGYAAGVNDYCFIEIIGKMESAMR